MWQRAVTDQVADWLITQFAFQQLVLLQPIIDISFHSKRVPFISERVCWQTSLWICLFAISHPRTVMGERKIERERVWEVNKREEMMLCWQMDLINNLGFIKSTGKIGPAQWLPDGGVPSPLSSSFHGIMKCKVRNRILLQFSAQYQNMSLPFDCVYSGCESRPTMPVLTQQTDRVYAACQGAGMLDCQGWSWHCCCYHSGAQKLGIQEDVQKSDFLLAETVGSRNLS